MSPSSPHPPRLSFHNGSWWLDRTPPAPPVRLGPLLLRHRWHVTPLAGELGLTRRTFERIVAESLDLTPKEWLRRERIVTSIRVLRCGLPVKHAATEAGFRPVGGAFAAEFKHWTGLCPHAFTEMLRTPPPAENNPAPIANRGFVPSRKVCTIDRRGAEGAEKGSLADPKS